MNVLVNLVTKQTDTFKPEKFTKNDAETIYESIMPSLYDLKLKDLAQTIHDLSMLVIPLSQSTEEFKKLIARTKEVLASEQA